MLVYVWNPEVAGKKLRAVRSQKGLTCTDVANAIGVSRQLIQFYENAEKSPTPQTMAALASYYQVSLEDLFFELLDNNDYEDEEDDEEEEEDDDAE